MIQGTTYSRPLARQFDFASNARIGWKAPGRNFRIPLLLILWLTTAPIAVVASEGIFVLSIPASKADIAIKRLAHQTKHLVIFQTQAVEQIETNALVGSYTLQQALVALLQGTALSGGLTRRGVITVSRQTPDKSEGNQMNSKNILLAMIGALFVSGGEQAAAQDDAIAKAQPAKGSLIEEITVTASRRESSLQDTSMSVSVMSGSDLEKRGAASISDVINSVPGVDMASAQPGGSQIIIRGVSTNNSANSGAEAIQNATTSTYIDDFVIGNTFLKTPDVYLVDMARVEVLKGPQGTLYGQSAMGGVVRYITNKPHSQSVEGGGTLIANTVDGGDRGYGGQGYLNVPLSENLAMRFAGYSLHEGGFIDADSASTSLLGAQLGDAGETNANEVATIGGRLAFRWQPTSNITLDAAWFYHDVDADGRQGVTSTFDVTPSPVAPLATSPNGLQAPDFDDLSVFAKQPYHSQNRGLNLKLNMDFQGFDLSVMGGRQNSNVSYFLNAITYIDAFEGGIPERDEFKAETDTLEIRLVSDTDSGQFFNWLAGLWYEDTSGAASVLNFYDGPGSVVFGLPLVDGDKLVDLNRYYRSNEIAVYGEAALNFTEQLILTLGYRRSDVEIDTGFDKAAGNFDLFIGRDGLVGAPSKSQEDVNTYKFKLEYAFPGEDVLLFAQATSGYRAGGLNAGGLLVLPSPFVSDTLWNYELGAKTTWLDGRLVVNASAYLIDWTDIQLTTVLDPVTFTSGIGNAGAAKIRGLELESAIQLAQGLTLGANIGYTDAKLDDDYDPSGLGAPVAFKGDQLPGSAKWTHSLFADWRHPINADMDLMGRIFYYRVDERLNDISGSVVFPAYERTDLKLGVVLANGPEITLFADNVFNKIGRTSLGNIGGYVDSVGITRPRTLGIRVSHGF